MLHLFPICGSVHVGVGVSVRVSCIHDVAMKFCLIGITRLKADKILDGWLCLV